MILYKGVAKCDGYPNGYDGNDPCPTNEAFDVLLNLKEEVIGDKKDWFIYDGKVMCPACAQKMLRKSE